MLTLPSCLRRNRPPRFLLPVFTALTLLAAALLPPATAAPGDLDPTFGIGGKMTTDISTNSPDAALSVALQSDGKILVAGFSIGLNNDFALARYTSTGVLDTAFGDNFGKSTTAVGSGHDRGHSVAVQSDGKILVAGYSFIGSNNDFALVRYTSTGALDTTFGAGGKVTTPIGSGNDTGYSVAVQSNGRILVAGTSSNGGNDDFALARYWSTGALDTTFGTGGKVITPIGSGNDTGLCMAVQSDGKIIVAGSAHNGINNDFALVRYTSTGALDTTFGTGGKVITAPLHYASTSGQLYGVAVQSDDKIVVTGYTTDVRGYTDIVLVRYTSEGALDTSFNNSGKVITPIGRIDENEIGYAVALQNDGKILVAGVAGGPNTGGRRFALLRYTSAGTLDTSFGGGDGVVTTSVNAYDEGRGIAVQSDGRIVVAGGSDSSSFDFALVRYQGDEELPVLPPEIVVSGSGVIIANGDTTPSTADGTSFGTLSSPGETLERTFAITNNGTTPLTLTGNAPNYVTLSGSSDFMVTTQATTPVAPGATTTFTVTFAPSTRGLQSATVSIANSDADENPSTFRIQGIVPEAEITVRGNGLNISAGDTSPKAADNTDFGNVWVEGTSKGERTFTILNSGPAQLDLTGNAPNYVTLSGSSDFTVTTQPTTPVASNGTTSFTISFNPSSTGLKTATVSIANTDLNEDPYTFVIQGTGSLPMPGDLDFAFGGGTGKVTTSIGSTSDYGRSVAVQNDDKIVVAGYSFNGSNNDFALARYTSMGALDTSFGNGGKVTTPIGSSSDDRGNSVAVQSDGKIVVAGYIFNGSNADFALARYTSTGALDTSFGNGGKVTTPMGPANDYGYSVAVQSDGKIVMGGQSSNGSNADFALVRYTSTGALDTTFGNGGKVTTPVGSENDFVTSVVLQSDGKIVVAGSSQIGIGTNYDFALVRYTSTGALDTTFGNGGKVITPIGSDNDEGFSVAVQRDGKIVVAGYSLIGSNYDFALVRYTSTGVLDTTFGNGGKVTTPIGSSSDDRGSSVAVQSDGKIVVAGYFQSGVSNNDFAVVRYTSAGALDASFGGGTGKMTTAISAGTDQGHSVALQSDGNIVVGGSCADVSGYSDFALVRYLGGPLLPTITTGVASAITAGGAVLSGMVDASGADTTVSFEYGLTTTYGSTTSATPLLVTGNIATAVSAAITSLTPGTTYHFRVKATSSAGTSYGENGTFTTLTADADGDGLLDSWELAHFGTTTGHDALGDFDGDGHSELLELAFGSSPTVADASLTPMVVNEAGYLTITLTKQPGAAYTVQTASDPSDPSFSAATTTVLLDSATTLKVRDNVPVGASPRRFLRVRVTAAP